MTWRRPASSAPWRSSRTICQPAVWLGDLHYRAGRLQEAIAIYETAQLRSPGASELQEQLARWRQEHELQSRFLEVRTEHFTAIFEAPTDEPLARAALDRLEAAYWRVGNTLGVYPPQPITVVLYTREQFGDITKLAAWSAAAYDGRIRVPLSGALEQPDELDRVLSHEFVHAVVAMLGRPHRPAWVNEGLATVLEPAGPKDAEAALASGAAVPRCPTAPRLRHALQARRGSRLWVGRTGRSAHDRAAWRGRCGRALEDLAEARRSPARSSSASRCATKISRRSWRASKRANLTGKISAQDSNVLPEP